MINANTLPRLGGGEDLVRGFRLFAAPRQFCHGAEEAPGTLGRWHLRQSSRDFTVRCEELQFWEGEVTEPVVPSHEFGLVVGGGEIELLVLLWRGSWIKREVLHAGGVVRLPSCAGFRR